MERPEAYCFSAAFSCTFLASCLLFSALNRQQRAAYMDETFHVPQAQAYCAGRFQQWDPMITTLPGLYLVSVGILKPAAWLFGWSASLVCSMAVLRFINLLFSIGNFYLLYLLFYKIHHKKVPFRRRIRGKQTSTGIGKDSYLVFLNCPKTYKRLPCELCQHSHLRLCFPLYIMIQHLICYCLQRLLRSPDDGNQLLLDNIRHDQLYHGPSSFICSGCMNF